MVRLRHPSLKRLAAFVVLAPIASVAIGLALLVPPLWLGLTGIAIWLLLRQRRRDRARIERLEAAVDALEARE